MAAFEALPNGMDPTHIRVFKLARWGTKLGNGPSDAQITSDSFAHPTLLHIPLTIQPESSNHLLAILPNRHLTGVTTDDVIMYQDGHFNLIQAPVENAAYLDLIKADYEEGGIFPILALISYKLTHLGGGKKQQ